jgi:eukaryotic-like serine/threonine-protein kinase
VTEAGAVLAARYQLDDRIAVGGAGDVWRAVDVMLDRPVAVKLLRAEYAQHPETLTRFRSEARHAASLSHPGVAQVFDYFDGTREHPAFLVMELVDGPSLADVLARGALDPIRVMDIIAQAAAALDAAHRSGLVHRDIKPANLLLTRAGLVKITDFGIAHAAGSAPVTRQGTLIGTPAYLAPERVAGHPATPASDLYSLGILAHECLTGTRPYDGTPAEIALAHGQRALPPLPGHVPSAVASFVADLTATEPAARPASARLASARAARLRDSLVTKLPAQQEVTPQEQTAPVMTAGEPPATLADPHPPWHTEAARVSAADAQRDHRGWPRRRVALAVGAASVVAGLTGWMVSGATAASPPAPAPAPASSSSAPAQGHSALTVPVQSDALIGEPVGAAVQQLRSLGLRPTVTWLQGSDESSGRGTVVSVQPSGLVTIGSVVTVTALQRHHGGGRHNQGGDEHGNGGD